ncbi:hypothetical protein RJ639_043198 [Escallonia herrerae]|uniref:GH18 domain-containing protein n=1 Tax=Escallonia herrerae TaxID=1293975 RepID=A0AA88WBE3_9ASTE|nr:hypothetical protein RJ639_043198 [Escallonia herrerae]
MGDGSAYFNPSSVDSWVSNAVSSLTDIIQPYNLDGIDIDYEHFNADPDTFAECIGQLITTLKNNGIISFASIAPYDDDQGTTVSQFMKYFETQRSNYNGGMILASFATDGSVGLSPDNGFFNACNRLKSRQELSGIFIWSTDDSMSRGFDMRNNHKHCWQTRTTDSSKLFREYIGAESDMVKLSDVPINSEVEFHFILAFAIDYTNDNHPLPTNGKFRVFWETNQLSPAKIASIKDRNPNVKVSVSLAGDSVGNGKALFAPKSINSWVQNAVSSLTSMITHYSLDGIDVEYENYKSDPETFAECIGQLITSLKKTGTISFASIAPYEDYGPVQRHYLALWEEIRTCH